VSLLGKVVVFALREVARPTLEKIGEHVGDAIGNVIGKKIDPTHGIKLEVVDGDAETGEEALEDAPDAPEEV